MQIGSSGRTRTYNPPVNSLLGLTRWRLLRWFQRDLPLRIATENTQDLDKDLDSRANAGCPGPMTARREQRQHRGTDQQPPPFTGVHRAARAGGSRWRGRATVAAMAETPETGPAVHAVRRRTEGAMPTEATIGSLCLANPARPELWSPVFGHPPGRTGADRLRCFRLRASTARPLDWTRFPEIHSDFPARRA